MNILGIIGIVCVVVGLVKAIGWGLAGFVILVVTFLIEIA